MTLIAQPCCFNVAGSLLNRKSEALVTVDGLVSMLQCGRFIAEPEIRRSEGAYFSYEMLQCGRFIAEPEIQRPSPSSAPPWRFNVAGSLLNRKSVRRGTETVPPWCFNVAGSLLNRKWISSQIISSACVTLQCGRFIAEPEISYTPQSP